MQLTDQLQVSGIRVRHHVGGDPLQGPGHPLFREGGPQREAQHDLTSRGNRVKFTIAFKMVLPF